MAGQGHRRAVVRSGVAALIAGEFLALSLLNLLSKGGFTQELPELGRFAKSLPWKHQPVALYPADERHRPIRGGGRNGSARLAHDGTHFPQPDSLENGEQFLADGGCQTTALLGGTAVCQLPLLA